MAPAFSSPRTAGAFALLLALLLALPALVAKTGWLDRHDVYPAIPWKYGPFAWIQHKIFAETSDVDIAFLGSSHIWNAVDTPYVQSRLSEHLGHDAEVFTLGWPWGGFDALYIIARDLMNHRRVHVLVINDEGGSDVIHLHSSRWFRMGENSEALAGLPLWAQAGLYSGAVLGMPRQLLSMARPNLLDDPSRVHDTFWDTYYRAPNVAQNRGALRARLSYGVNRDFLPFHPGGQATPDDVLLYSTESREAFRFTGPATQTYQLYFARKLARLCAERGTTLVVLQTPYLPESGEKFISVREKWPEVLGAPVDLVGIPPAKLFAGIPADDISRLFYEDWHLNQNGEELFTPLITPAIVAIYDSSIRRH